MPESNDVAPNGADDDSDIRLIDVNTGAISATLGKPKIPDLKIALPAN